MQLDYHLRHIFQDHGFSPFGLATGHSPIAIVRRDLVTPSPALHVPPISSSAMEELIFWQLDHQIG